MTEKLGKEKNKKFEPIQEVDTEENITEWKKFQRNVKAANGSTIRIKTILDESGLERLKEVKGLYDYAVKQSKNGTELDSKKVNELIQDQNAASIAEQAHGFKGVNAAIDEYNKNLKKNDDGTTEATAKTKKLTEALAGTNPQLAECLNNAKGGGVSFGSYAGALIKAKVSTIGLELATTAMNAALSMGASAAIQWLISGISYLIHYEEKQKEAFENAKAATAECAKSIRDLKSEMADTSSKASSLSSEFAELVQGVDPFTNENKSLSTESYERFLEVNNQLAELFPSLTKNYDDNGNAILGLSGNVDSVTASIERLVEQQNNLAKAKIRENLETYVNGDGKDSKGVFKVLEGQNKAVTDAQDELDKLKDTYNKIMNPTDIKYNISDTDAYFEYIKKYFGEDVADIMRKNLEKEIYYFSNEDPDYFIDFSKLQLDEETKNKIKTSYNTFYNDLKATLETKKSELEATNKEMSSMMMTWVEDNTLYQDGNESFQKFIENMVYGLDWSSFDVKEGDLDSAKQIIQELILNPLTNACGNPDTKLKMMDALNNLLSFDFSQLNYKEAGEKIRGFLTTIMNAINEGVPDEQKKSLNDMYEMFHLDGYKNINLRMRNNISAISEDKAADYRTLTEYTKDFTQAQAETWLEATHGATSAQDAIKKYEKSLNDPKNAASAFTDSISKVQSLSKGLDQLSQIYADVNDKGNFDWSSILNNEEFKDTFGNFTNEYNDFIKTVSNSPDDINACQSAFNNLATAYINGSDAMRNLSSETEETTIKMLEQMGVNNAQTIVKNRLAAQEAFLAEKKKNAAIASNNLTDATWNEIGAVLASGNASAETTTYLAQLALAKLNLSENPIDTTDDINAIIALANAAGTSSEYVEALETALAHLDTVQTAIKEEQNPLVKMGLLADEAATKAEASRLADEIKNGIVETQLNPEDFYTKFGSGSKSYSGSSDTSASDTAAAAEETAETFNWVETALSRVQRTIQNLGKTVSATWQSWTKRNTALASQLSETRREIDLQQSAYEQYMAKAESVGLPDFYKHMVQGGALSIEDITDETLKEQIHDYQDWYEKALACRDAIDDLTDSLSSLYKTDFDNTASQFDSFLSVIEHRRSMLDKAISQTEEKGLLVSAEYYKALIRTEEENLAQLAQKKNALLLSLNNAVANGAIEEYSQDWYDMRGQIDDVTQAIEEANTAMIQYGNSIRDIKWETFDLLQERISGITSESDFLLNLLENKTLYDKNNGQLTNEGMAAMGLHGLNYDIYMAQSEKYAQEMLDIDKQLADDPYNQTLADRRQKLLELQRESILAAESEKQAIKDMVEEGIKLELESLKELIDTYTDALDSQKELYDYQKKVSKQTEAIAALQKQLSAYEGDDSEENRAKLQQIKVSLEEKQEDLEETEYEKYIADQKQLLDDLYLEYELVLNQRLDNLDALLADMITGINENATTISTTLSDTASNVGTTLSESMRSIWDTSTGTITQVLAAYGENILTSNNNVNSTLSGMNQNLQNMITQLNTLAETKIQSVAASAAAVSSPVVGLVGGSSAASPSPAPTSSGGGASDWGSWFIRKVDSYSKDKLKKDSSIVDRLKWFNYDSSKEARGIYFAAMGGSGNYTGSEAQNVWMLNQMKANGYSQGGYIADLQRTAYRNGDNMITVNTLKRGEAVLTPAQAEQFERLLGKLDTAELALNLPNALAQLPQNLASGHNGPIKNEIQMEVVLPNVQSYEDFKYAMQHDKNFEKMVQAMTVGRAAGGSSLKKYRY